jgi:hypothetical protein
MDVLNYCYSKHHYIFIYLSIHLTICGSTAVSLASDAFLVSDLFTQSVGLLGRGISPSQGCYLHAEHTNTE